MGIGAESDGGQRSARSYAVIGAAMEVHRTDLGTGFLEAVYQEALAVELEDSGDPVPA